MIARLAENSAKDARVSIGALSRATGIPVETLRTWESRYGFPVPERRPSGHRLYPLAIVPRLRRIAEAYLPRIAGRAAEARWRRLAGHLQRRGFDNARIYEICAELLPGIDPTPE